MRHRLTILIFVLLTSSILIWFAIQQRTSHEERTSHEDGVGFVVPRENLPTNVLTLADHLNKLTTTYSLNDFGEHLQLVGLNPEPDHWKDFNYFWSIPKQPDQVDSYSLTATVGPMDNGQTLTIRDARIRLNSDGAILGWKTVWEMDFSAKKIAALHSEDSRLMGYKIAELKRQIESIDRCSVIQTYDGDQDNVNEFFRLHRPSAVNVWPVPLSSDNFGNLKFMSISEDNYNPTNNLLVLVDDERMRIVDSVLLRDCETLWFENPAEYPWRVGARFSDGTHATYELTEGGFSKQFAE